MDNETIKNVGLLSFRLKKLQRLIDLKLDLRYSANSQVNFPDMLSMLLYEYWRLWFDCDHLQLLLFHRDHTVQEVAWQDDKGNACTDC